MRRPLKIWLVVLGWLALIMAAAPASGQPVPATQAEQDAAGRASVAWLTARLWIRETTGNNDGPAVADLIRCGGGVPGEHPAYCGFTQACNQRAHGLPIPGHGMQGAAKAWFQDPARDEYVPGRRGTAAGVRLGYKLGFSYGRGIHHVGAVVEIVPNEIKGRPPRGFWSIAGNEGRGTSAGLHRTFYATPGVAAASNWNH